MPRKKKGVLPSGSVRVQVYNYTDDSGKRHYQSFTAATRAEAQALAEDWKRSRKTLKERLTVSDAVARYIDLKAAVLSPSTVRNYRGYARQYFGGSFGSRDLRNIQSTDMQQWISGLSAQGLSPKTVRNAAGLLTATLALFLPDFRPRVTLPAKKRTELYCPSLDDIMALYHSTADPYLRCAILLGSVGAMRRGEICALEYSDIRGDRVTIDKALVIDEHREWQLKAPKTYSSYRTIKLPPYVLAAIDELPPPHEGRIIRINPDALRNRFVRALEKTSLPRFRFHDLRHFGASMLAGYGDRYVEAYGGWEPGSDIMKRSYQTLIDSEAERVKGDIAAMFEQRLSDYATQDATRQLENSEK